jgi:hypothetical protein
MGFMVAHYFLWSSWEIVDPFFSGPMAFRWEKAFVIWLGTSPKAVHHFSLATPQILPLAIIFRILVMMHHGIDLHRFTLFGVYSVSWVCRFFFL